MTNSAVTINKVRKLPQGHGAYVVKRVSRDGDLPLSFAQQRIWFLDQMAPGLAVYNLPTVLRLTGWLNLQAMNRVFSEVVNRHEIMRTIFPVISGKPVQQISEAEPFALPVVDLRELPPDLRNVIAERMARAEARRPFNLERGPLVRAVLLRLSNEDHTLVITMHHIISDGWSNRILFREMAFLYEAFCAGKPSPLPPLPIQYADFACWQRESLKGGALEKHLSYWRQNLGGTLPVLELPTDRPRAPVQKFNGARESITLPSSLAQSLRGLSAREGATLFITLLSAYKALCHCYSGQEDIIIGAPVAGRSLLETEGLIGLFINMVVLRTDLSGNPEFKELLRRVSKVVWGAQAHQGLPFEKLVEDLQPQRDQSRAPLVQAIFNMLNFFTAHQVELHGLTLKSVTSLEDQPKFDLALNVVERSEVIQLQLVYAAELFDAETASRILANLELILTEVSNRPEIRLSELKAVIDEAGRAYELTTAYELAEMAREDVKRAKRKLIRGKP